MGRLLLDGWYQGKNGRNKTANVYWARHRCHHHRRIGSITTELAIFTTIISGPLGHVTRYGRMRNRSRRQEHPVRVCVRVCACVCVEHG